MKFTYKVEGSGEFPRDMLRYDSSRPVGCEDRALTEADIGDDILLHEVGGRKRLRTYQVALGTSSPASPATKRWESFGFRVVSVSPGLRGEVSAPAPGRPRLHAETAPASERSRVSDMLHAMSGGSRRSVRLSAEALASLAAVRAVTGETSDAAVIERVLREEGCRAAADSRETAPVDAADLKLLQEIHETGSDEYLWFWQRKRLLRLGLYRREEYGGLGYLGWKAVLTDEGRSAVEGVQAVRP